MSQRRVVCAANLNKKSGRITLGVRHWDSFMHNVTPDDEVLDDWEQGFVDQFGRFMTRKEAWVVATESHQIIRRVGGDGTKLYSENLY